MRKSLLIIALGVGLLTPTLTRADFVTVHGTVGKLDAPLITKDSVTGDLTVAGIAEVWNTAMEMNIRVTPPPGCLLSKVFIWLDNEPPPWLPSEYAGLTDEEMDELWVEPDFGEWPFGKVFKKPTALPYWESIQLSELAFLKWGLWGEPWVQLRTVYVAVCVELKTTDTVPVTFRTWAVNPTIYLEAQKTLWGENTAAFAYELQHPKEGHFVGPVHGLSYKTATHEGTTGVEGGGFRYFPGETVYFNIGGVYIGSANANNSVSPLDIFPGLEITDAAVVNMSRLLLTMDTDDTGVIDISGSAALLPQAKTAAGIADLDFHDTAQIDSLIAALLQLAESSAIALTEATAADALLWVDNQTGATLMRRNISKSPYYDVDKPKLDIIPVWVPARTASGLPATIDYKDADGNVLETRNMAKPLMVTYTEERDTKFGGRRASDIITAVSLDDGATWKRFNVSHMASMSSFTVRATGEKFPGDCRTPQQKIAADKILVVWTSAYARGGKPSFAIKKSDDYPYDDAYAVDDIWGVRGSQGSVNYDLDKDVGDQGIGEIPYYAMWACRGVLVYEGNISKYPGHELGDIVWFKPERLTSGRRDSFLPVVGSAKDAGFAIAWQEDPGGLRPGQCMAGGEGWSGATVHKKTDIWYSFIKWSDFDKVDANWVPADHTDDEHGEFTLEEDHGMQPEISNRLKWLVPMSLPVRVSDNNTVNTDNLKVQLDPVTGLPLVDPVTGSYIPLLGAEEEDYVRHEHEHDDDCGDTTVVITEENEHDDHGETGSGGGWGMARYAYKLPGLGLVDLTGSTQIWKQSESGEYQPTEGVRWFQFVNQPGVTKTVAVTADGRVLDGDTGAGRPVLTLTPYSYKLADGTSLKSAWAMLAYEETKGLGTPSDSDHEEITITDVAVTAETEEPAPGEKGKDVIYHSFRFDTPDMVSAGNVVNLPALDPVSGEPIPIYYKDATGADTTVIRQYATENARRPRFLAQPFKEMGATRTPLVIVYKQGMEGNGKPSDIFAVRAVVPGTDKATDNPYRFQNLKRFGEGAETPSDTVLIKTTRKHMNMTSAKVEEMDPVLTASDNEGHTWYKVSKYSQSAGNLSDESYHNPYSDAKGHRGFIDGDTIVLGYSFTPNWGRLGGDHMDFFVRRSFDGGQTWTTDPAVAETVHTVIERDANTGEYKERQIKYGAGVFEPARNVSLLKGNKYTVTDPRLVPPMGPGTVNPQLSLDDDTYDPNTYYVAFGTAEVLHGLGEPLGETDTVKADIFYTRTTDRGTTWETVPWVINPESESPQAGETVYRFPWLAQGAPHQGHAQIRMHPSGTRLYAIWHQWTNAEETVSPHDVGNDIWFRRIDFMK